MGIYSNLYSAVKYKFMPIDDKVNPLNIPANVQAIDDYFLAVTNANAVQSIVNLVMFPKAYYSNDAAVVGKLKKIVVPKTNGNYVPRNNKLLTFPYTFLSVETPNTQKIYRFEFFDTFVEDNVEKIALTLSMCVSANPELACIPQDYKGIDWNYTDETVLTGYPQLAFTIDSYRAWLAQTGGGGTALLGILGSMVTGGAGLAFANPISATHGVIGTANTIFQNVIEATKGDTVKGTIVGSIDTANRKFGFWFKIYGLLPEYAKIIDDYFSRFGYACRQLKIPNTHVRENWTYTKTDRCTVTGSVPAEDKAKICSIFDKGITFWVNPYAVGNFSNSNRCLSELPPSP